MEQKQAIILSDDIHSALDPALERYLLHAYCTAGSCRFTYNDRALTLGAGDCMIIPSRRGQLHGLAPDADFRVQIIYVERNFVEICTPQSNYGMRGHVALFADPVMHLRPEQQRVCALNFDYIRRRYALSRHHFHRDAMINAVQCMIIDFFDFHVELYGDRKVTSTNATLMQRFLSMLDRGDYRRQREVAYYADSLCVTPKHLADVCRRISGESPMYWITRYTALEISRLLRNRNLSIEEISDLFGFSSLSYFNRYVQRNLGVSPRYFRE